MSDAITLYKGLSDLNWNYMRVYIWIIRWCQLTMSNNLPAVFTRASEYYSKNTALRAVVNLIPAIGSSLDIIFASKGQEITQRRVYNFFDVLKEELEATVRTRNTAKIELYTKVLSGAIKTHDRSEFSPEDYLATLIELTPREIEVLLAIYQQQGNDEPREDENILKFAWRKGWKTLHRKLPSLSEEDLPFIFLRIQRSGLIREVTGAFLGYQGGTYVITPALRKMMRYLTGNII
jgi:hypothetical protein